MNDPLISIIVPVYGVEKYIERCVRSIYKFDHAEGSRYFYIKDGVMTEPIPFHGSKEIGKGLASKLIRKYDI